MQRLPLFPAVILALGLIGCRPAAEVVAPTQAPPPAVGVATAALKEITPAMEFVGRVEAIDAVDLVARVNGFLAERLFQEGATVEEGQLAACGAAIKRGDPGQCPPATGTL